MASKKNFVFQSAGSVPVSPKVCTCFSHVPWHGERTYVHRSAVQQTRSSRFVAISKHSLSRYCTTELQSRSADFGADHLDPPFIAMILARTQNRSLPKKPVQDYRTSKAVKSSNDKVSSDIVVQLRTIRSLPNCFSSISSSSYFVILSDLDDLPGRLLDCHIFCYTHQRIGLSYRQMRVREPQRLR